MIRPDREPEQNARNGPKEEKKKKKATASKVEPPHKPWQVVLSISKVQIHISLPVHRLCEIRSISMSGHP